MYKMRQKSTGHTILWNGGDYAYDADDKRRIYCLETDLEPTREEPASSSQHAGTRMPFSLNKQLTPTYDPALNAYRFRDGTVRSAIELDAQAALDSTEARAHRRQLEQVRAMNANAFAAREQEKAAAFSRQILLSNSLIYGTLTHPPQLAVRLVAPGQVARVFPAPAWWTRWRQRWRPTRTELALFRGLVTAIQEDLAYEEGRGTVGPAHMVFFGPT